MAKALRRAVALDGDSAHLYHHDVQLNSLHNIVGAPGAGGGGSGGGGGGIVNASLLTADDETGLLANSFKLVEGVGITLTKVASTLVVSATPSGGGRAVQSSSAPTATIADGEVMFLGSATPGADQIANLPAATGSTFLKIIKKVDANPHNVVVTAAGGDLIDGGATYTVGPRQYAAVTLVDTGLGVWSVANEKP